MINVPLLRKTMEHIENHPEEWHQAAWITRKVVDPDDPITQLMDFPEEIEYHDRTYMCRTAFCFAGHAALLAGATIQSDSPLLWSLDAVITPDGARRHVRNFAQEELGISPADADKLFVGDNTMHELRYAVDMLIEKGSLDDFKCSSPF